jgi:uncharacterized protein YndB with AHSA1/START domain
VAEASNDTRADELIIVRTFNAPRELVFAAWTEPEHLAHWSGPAGFTSTQGEMDVRPGGRYRACLHAPDGTQHWVQGVYREIVPPSRLVMTHGWADPEGRVETETLVTVTLDEDGPGRTRMHFRQAGFGSRASRDGHDEGWRSSFERLAAHVDAQP